MKNFPIVSFLKAMIHVVLLTIIYYLIPNRTIGESFLIGLIYIFCFVVVLSIIKYVKTNKDETSK